MMKNANALALALTLTVFGDSAHAATYNGDLLVGFTDSVSSDLIYDLGAASSITNGQQWNLSSLLTSFNLAGVNWGVVGTARVSSGPTSWITTTGISPLPVLSNALWVRINNAIMAMYSSFASAGAGQNVRISPLDDNSWNQQAINGTLTTQYHNVYQDPDVLGTNCASFYSAISSNLPPAFLGSFCLSPSGILTFTVPSAGPPQPTLQIARTGNTSTIAFYGTNNVTYTLYYTNNSGLSTPTASWPSLPGTISGNNSTTNFTDASADPDRFYRVKAQ
jgi:hypothetical protein